MALIFEGGREGRVEGGGVERVCDGVEVWGVLRWCSWDRQRVSLSIQLPGHRPGAS